MMVPWVDPGWLQQAGAWIATQLERLGLHSTGPVEQLHAEPWSTVIRVPVLGGALYFKATAPFTLHEPALVQRLSREWPDRIPALLAADLEHGWMLTADAGQRLREIIRPSGDVSHWYRALPLYAELQIGTSRRVDDLLAMGVPDRRLSILPAEYEALLSSPALLQTDLPGGVAHEERRRLERLTPRIRELCEELAGYGVPESLHHGDVRDANVFLRYGSYMFIDWGDASVAHPFCSLRMTLESTRSSLGLEEHSAELQRLRDAYLEPWTAHAPRDRLLRALDIALPLAAIIDALVWVRILTGVGEEAGWEYAPRIPRVLGEFLGEVN